MVCPFCNELILADDKLGMSINMKTHYECEVRSIMGGIEHLTAPKGHTAGTCYDGSELSYRESARQAVQWIKEHGVDNA